MISNDQLHSIVAMITSKFQITDIFLFGSYAEGKENIGSDLDLCVITHLDNRRKIDIMRAIRREINNIINIPMDILIYDIDEFQKRAAHQNTLEYKIQNRGILLNG